MLAGRHWQKQEDNQYTSKTQKDDQGEALVKPQRKGRGGALAKPRTTNSRLGNVYLLGEQGVVLPRL